jgi:hypothetical protein
VQLLAAAVVQQAICDACDRSLPREVRDEARQFLGGNPSYRFWCEVSEKAATNGHTHARANGHAVLLPTPAPTPGAPRLTL